MDVSISSPVAASAELGDLSPMSFTDDDDDAEEHSETMAPSSMPASTVKGTAAAVLPSDQLQTPSKPQAFKRKTSLTNRPQKRRKKNASLFTIPVNKQNNREIAAAWNLYAKPARKDQISPGELVQSMYNVMHVKLGVRSEGPCKPSQGKERAVVRTCLFMPINWSTRLPTRKLVQFYRSLFSVNQLKNLTHFWMRTCLRLCDDGCCLVDRACHNQIAASCTSFSSDCHCVLHQRTSVVPLGSSR